MDSNVGTGSAHMFYQMYMITAVLDNILTAYTPEPFLTFLLNNNCTTFYFFLRACLLSLLSSSLFFASTRCFWRSTFFFFFILCTNSDGTTSLLYISCEKEEENIQQKRKLSIKFITTRNTTSLITGIPGITNLPPRCVEGSGCTHNNTDTRPILSQP